MERERTEIEAGPGQHPIEDYRRVFGEVRSVAENRGRPGRLREVDEMFTFAQRVPLADFIVRSEFQPGRDDVALYAVGCLWNLGERSMAREFVSQLTDRISDHKDPSVAEDDHRLLQAAEDLKAYMARHPND